LSAIRANLANGIEYARDTHGRRAAPFCCAIRETRRA
jgi:hypothetical protein